MMVFIGTAVAAAKAVICIDANGGMIDPGGIVQTGSRNLGIIQTGTLGAPGMQRLQGAKLRLQALQLQRPLMQRPQLRRRQLLPQRRHKIRNHQPSQHPSHHQQTWCNHQLLTGWRLKTPLSFYLTVRRQRPCQRFRRQRPCHRFSRQRPCQRFQRQRPPQVTHAAATAYRSCGDFTARSFQPETYSCSRAAAAVCCRRGVVTREHTQGAVRAPGDDECDVGICKR